jgi:hypothetical protein
MMHIINIIPPETRDELHMGCTATWQQRTADFKLLMQIAYSNFLSSLAVLFFTVASCALMSFIANHEKIVAFCSVWDLSGFFLCGRSLLIIKMHI